MKTEKNKSIKLNISNDDDNTNDFLYSWSVFGDRPNKIKIYNNFSKNEFYSIIDEVSSSSKSSIDLIPADDFDIVNEKNFIRIDDGIFLSFSILDRESDNSFIQELTFFYKSVSDLDRLNEIINRLNECVLTFEEGDDYKLNTVYLTEIGLEIEPIDTIKQDDNIDLYYSTNTMKSIDKLTKTLKKSKKGITVLYGERGTGKTSIINHICDKLDKIFIYIPNNMLDITINSPEFRTFLKKYQHPIIVIDDCEMIFNDLYSKSNIYVNNILQMVDGLLSDSILLNIITIFNVDNESEIDHMLLESNSLVDVVEFEYLNIEEANELTKHLGFNKKYKNKTRLVDIIRRNKTIDYKKIGLE